MKESYEKGQFDVSGILERQGEAPIEAYSNGQTWNGFDVPVVPMDEAKRLMDAIVKANGDDPETTFTVVEGGIEERDSDFPDEPPKFHPNKTVKVGGKTVEGVVFDGYCFERDNPEPAAGPGVA